MTGNTRNGMGLMALAGMAALLWFALGRLEGTLWHGVSTVAGFLATVIAFLGLGLVAGDLLRSPQRD